MNIQDRKVAFGIEMIIHDADIYDPPEQRISDILTEGFRVRKRLCEWVTSQNQAGLPVDSLLLQLAQTDPPDGLDLPFPRT